MSACVANFVKLLFPMSLTDKGEVLESFACTEVLSKSQNASLTQLKKRGLLTSETCKDDEGKKLIIHLTESGLALFGEMLAESQEVEEVEDSEEEMEAADAPESDAEEDDDFEPLVIKDDVAPAPAAAAPVARNLAGVFGIFDALPEAGTVLTKVYKGTSFNATLASDGSCTLDDGRVFSSLTAAARFITGAKNISGRKFFGCAGKRVAKAEVAAVVA